MKSVAIIGTSNSIVGERGYVKALRNSFAVDNLSIGRVPVHRHIAVLAGAPARLERADLILLEHYVNDIVFYARTFHDMSRFDDYMTHVGNFYRHLAALDVPVVNAFFPIDPACFAPAPARRCLDHLLDLSARYGFGILDLNALALDSHHFTDPEHITPTLSYLVGLGMVPGLHAALAAHAPRTVPGDGSVPRGPYRVIAARDLFPEAGTVTFSNSLTTLNYAPLHAPLTLDLAPREELIALGYFVPFKEERPAGIALGRHRYLLDGRGYFVESLPRKIAGPVTIAPLTGSQERVKGLMGRGDSGPMRPFAPPNFVEALIHDPTGVQVGDPAPLAFDDGPIRQAVDTVTFPAVGPQVVDALRDLAIRNEGRSVGLAHGLMRLAQYGRPDGPLILDKIAEYRARLDGGET